MRHLSRLSEATSQWTPLFFFLFFFFFFFFFLPVQTGKEEILTTPTGLCVGFFFPSLPYIWHGLRCCRLFVSLQCLIQSFPSQTDSWTMQRRGHIHTHTHIFFFFFVGPLAMIRITHTHTHKQQIFCVFFFAQICVSFEETGGAIIHKTDTYIHTYTHSGWLKEATDFSAPFFHSNRQRNTYKR